MFSAPNPDPFSTELKNRVATYFKESRRSPKADGATVAKVPILLAITFGAYGLILFGGFPPLVMLLLAVLMGAGLAGIGFSVGHEALHGTLSSRSWVNRMLGWTFDLLGANGYMWQITHNVIHHTYTNLHGVDEDLAVSPLLRLSPQAPRRWFQRLQHFYAFGLYSLTMLFWVFVKDYKYFLQRNLGPYQNRKHPTGAVVGLIGGKLLYYSYTIVIPLLVLHLPWWQFAIGYLAMHLTAGLILGVVFQMAHVVETTAHPQASTAGVIDAGWMQHEMATTANFACGNRWLSWYLGGLNFQIEHHLFSRVCSAHYPALRLIVREVALKNGVPYNEYPTFRSAVRSHFRTLRRLGRAQDVVTETAWRGHAELSDRA